MKINNNLVKPLIFGTWILRNTNDLNIENNLNYLIIENDNLIKFKSVDSNPIFGIKKSRTAEIKNLIENNETDICLIQFRYLKKNTYTYSFFGIEIPEIRTKSEDYNSEKNLTFNLYSNVLLIFDNNLSLYYTFDLYHGNIKSPYTETKIHTFLFTQIFGIIIGILINKLLN
jgi:hypothetical protein